MRQAPSRELLEQAVRTALRRGVPSADAEDIAVGAWEKADRAFDPDRGPFAALYHRTVLTGVADWWRSVGRRREVRGLGEFSADPVAADLEEVSQNQERLLEALSADERRVFATWALQKHLPQGGFTAERAAASLGMDVPSYDNAKRRLKARILRLADEWGLTPADFFSCDAGEGPRRKHAAGG